MNDEELNDIRARWQASRADKGERCTVAHGDGRECFRTDDGKWVPMWKEDVSKLLSAIDERDKRIAELELRIKLGDCTD